MPLDFPSFALAALVLHVYTRRLWDFSHPTSRVGSPFWKGVLEAVAHFRLGVRFVCVEVVTTFSFGVIGGFGTHPLSTAFPSLHSIAASFDCLLCREQLETSTHIFLQCPFSPEVWVQFRRAFPLTALPSSLRHYWASRRRERLSLMQRKFWNSLILAMPWSLSAFQRPQSHR